MQNNDKEEINENIMHNRFDLIIDYAKTFDQQFHSEDEMGF